MNQLKTLKDLSYGLNKIPNSHCNPNELKQEAIKWIKVKIKHIEDHSHEKFDWNKSYMDCTQCRNRFVQIAWIKHFFNITEEDFK